MQKKVLITGITGFAGQYLQEALQAQGSYTIAGTYHSDRHNLEQEHVMYKKIDLTDAEVVAAYIKEYTPDFVYHLAALTSPAKSFTHPSETITNNVQAQVNILEAIRAVKLTQTRILVVSSAEVYGSVASEQLPVDENTPLRPSSPYAVSKVTQDFLGLQYNIAHKLPIVRVRPFNHIGPRQGVDFVVAAFAKKIAEIEKGMQPPILKVGNLEAKRDFTDVRDMVKAYILALEMGKAGDVYNIGSGVSYKIAEIAERLISMATVKITQEVDESLLRPSDTPDIRCDNTKFVTLTGWKPEYTLDQTLKETLDYWRSIV